MNLINGDQFKILERLKTQGIQSVDAITQWQKKPKTAVRRTLLGLEKKGVIERLLQKSERGRPVLCYKLSPGSKAFFPSKESEVLNELIQYLMKLGHNSILEDFFSKYWDQRYELVMKRLSERKCQDLSTRLEVLKSVLNEDGFYARSNINKKNDQITLRECHCPIAAVATAVNIPCRLEAKLISRVLNADCTSASPMSAQQKSCVFTFKK
jgi:predicted ArsR family transcriptional regulator